MKNPKPKIVVKPHYIGTEKNTDLIKRILTEQIDYKLKSGENKADRDKITQNAAN